MVPMPMPVADVNSHRADSDFDVFRYDYWFVAGVRRSGKCRHGQKRNNEQGKQSILHDTTLFGWGFYAPPHRPECALAILEVCIGLTSAALDAPLNERGPGRRLSDQGQVEWPARSQAADAFTHDVSNFAQFFCGAPMRSSQIGYRSRSAGRPRQRLLRLALTLDLRLFVQNDIQQ